MSIEKRNMASSNVVMNSAPEASWTNWTVRKSVKEGYIASGWVYKAVNMICKNGASVPWVVVDIEKDEIVTGHPLAAVLARPNQYFSAQDFFEMIIAWQLLAGMGFAKKVQVAGVTKELWPVSPDRLSPIPSKDAGKLMEGYSIVDKDGNKRTTEDYTEDNTIPFKLIDPSNPLVGISPLQAVARAVDIDVEQQKWNKSAMQNRGVLDGIFTFNEPISETLYDLTKKRLKDMMSGFKHAREPGVIGSNAKYQQLSLSPVEMDFLSSRKFNREEIFIIFGVPPQLAGVQDSSTYNNYSISMRIFWENTIIPLLFDLANTFNMSFYDELEKGKYKIQPDLTQVMALRDNQDEIAKTSQVYFNMGVPVSIISEKFKLNLPKYEGWDKSWGGAKPDLSKAANEVKGENRKKFSLRSQEQRSIESEIDKKEEMAQVLAGSVMQEALDNQLKIILDQLSAGNDDISLSGDELMPDTLQSIYANSANVFAGTVIIDERGLSVDFEKREFDSTINTLILEFLSTESVILKEVSFINESTVNSVISIIADGLSEGDTIQNISQAIKDSGTFSSARALSIARTTVGTAQSIGQIAGAKSVGASTKTWHTAGFEVREEHQAREGETVDINILFSSQFSGYPAPRYPLDQNIAPADRISCRCSMTFS